MPIALSSALWRPTSSPWPSTAPSAEATSAPWQPPVAVNSGWCWRSVTSSSGTIRRGRRGTPGSSGGMPSSSACGSAMPHTPHELRISCVRCKRPRTAASGGALSSTAISSARAASASPAVNLVERTPLAAAITPSPSRKPSARSSSRPGVRIVSSCWPCTTSSSGSSRTITSWLPSWRVRTSAPSGACGAGPEGTVTVRCYGQRRHRARCVHGRHAVRSIPRAMEPTVQAGEGARVAAAATALRARIGDARLRALRLCIVLGSGLKDFAQRLDDRVEVAFGEVPHWPAPKVEGHGGALVVGRIGNTGVACLTGRVHLYEGWEPVEVVRAVRTVRALGVPAFLLTNAAGGIGEDLSAGDLMVITDHLNLTGRSPLIGPHEPAFGPRFPDQTRVYDGDLRRVLLQCATGLRQGVYAGLLGPSYETPAEVRMLKTLGAVGMSTVHEAIALGAMGARVAGLSLISNLAAGIADAPLSHAEVIEAGRKAAAALTALVGAFCQKL